MSFPLLKISILKIKFMSQINYSERFASHPDDVKQYDTRKLREHFLINHLFSVNEINLVYSHFDRFITGGLVPIEQELVLETIEPLKSQYFLERREIGIINIGGKGIVISDGKEYHLDYKEALYLGKGNSKVSFRSIDKTSPAHFYFNSTTAHCSYPNAILRLSDAEKVESGSWQTSNARRINKLMVNSVVKTCQLQMGLTELKTGSVWNTMPPHLHSRRMEVYLYFEVPAEQSICHFMGQPEETRHIWLHNEEAVISPDWSIHAAAGTGNYSFIWGMAGENLDYGDMDVYQAYQLK
jgi:4-deoxy-L-threo-5-hexosulose-uronate ketol-isomerase